VHHRACLGLNVTRKRGILFILLLMGLFPNTIFMSKENLQWIVIILLAVGVVTLIFANPIKPETTADFESLSQKFIHSDGMADFLMLEHVCDGQIIPPLYFPELSDAQQPTNSYCLGTNILRITERNSNESIIVDTRIATDPETAPLLQNTELLETENDQDRAVFVSYTPETCSTLGNCGAGMIIGEITGVYMLTNGSYRTLSEFPKSGTPIWNPEATKAVLYPESRGGAGYAQGPLMGYDLENDIQSAVTEVEAAWDEDGKTPFDVTGDELPAWTNFTWIDNDNFTATIINPDGSQLEISGTL